MRVPGIFGLHVAQEHESPARFLPDSRVASPERELVSFAARSFRSSPRVYIIQGRVSSVVTSIYVIAQWVDGRRESRSISTETAKPPSSSRANGSSRERALCIPVSHHRDKVCARGSAGKWVNRSGHGLLCVVYQTASASVSAPHLRGERASKAVASLDDARRGSRAANIWSQRRSRALREKHSCFLTRRRL